MSRTCRDRQQESVSCFAGCVEVIRYLSLLDEGEKPHLQHVLAADLVQITVGQSSDISTGLSRKDRQINGLSKYIVFPCGRRTRMSDTSRNVNLRSYKIQLTWVTNVPAHLI